MNRFEADVTGALWITRTTEQPAVMVPRPRPVDVFDQLVGGQPYPKRQRRPWHPFIHQLIGMALGLGMADIVVVTVQR